MSAMDFLHQIQLRSYQSALPVPGILRLCNHLQNVGATTYILGLQLSTFIFYNKQASNYTKSPLIQIDDLPGVKYDIQAMHKRLTQIGFEVKQIENISKDQIIPALEDNASHSPCDAIHIVYFTGHGGHNNGNNYIYPVDFASKFEKSKDIESSAMNIQNIISIYKGKGRLILILDACRSDFGLSKGYYSEITAAEDVYIAYGTQFQYTSIGIANQMSPFTQAICDEILEPTIDVDELFTRVRRNVYSKYQIQIPASVNALLNRIVLHKQLSYTNFDEEVYKFVKKYADDYNNKYGYFHGDDLIFIDAAQYFNISFLDAVWKFRKVDNKVYTDRGAKIPLLPEDESKFVTFHGLFRGKEYFTCDENHTWYYNGRQIRMGEIPPLPASMQPEAPEIGKELYVTFDIQKYDNSIIITTNLPDNYILLVKNNLSKKSDRKIVTNGSVMIENAQNISSITIGSAFITDSSVKEQLGKRARNLLGKYVKYDPVCGNQISAVFNF